MPGWKLKALLDARGTPYELLPHALAFTAQQTANALHVHGCEFAKSIVVHANGRRMMAIVPADMKLDLGKMALIAGGHTFDLVPEQELATLFPGEEVGAMPAMGNLFGMPVVMDRQLTQQDHIVFNSGSHTEAIGMKVADFLKLAHPTLADIATSDLDARSPPS